MRGRQEPQVTMLTFVDLEECLPADHPFRTMKVLADEARARLPRRVRPDVCRRGAGVHSSRAPVESVAAEIALFSVRSERAFCQELDYNLLFRWLLEHEIGQQLFDEMVLAADRRSLLSDVHFTVDGTLVEAPLPPRPGAPDGPELPATRA